MYNALVLVFSSCVSCRLGTTQFVAVISVSKFERPSLASLCHHTFLERLMVV